MSDGLHVRGAARAYGERGGYQPLDRPPRVAGEPVRDDWIPPPTPEVLRDLADRMARVTCAGWRRYLGLLMRQGADLSRADALDAAWTAYLCHAMGTFVPPHVPGYAPAHAADLLSPRALAALRALCGEEPEPEEEAEEEPKP